jgi:hypothetical protein
LKPIENKIEEDSDDGAWIVKDKDADEGEDVPSATISRKDKGASELYEKVRSQLA